ncbi:MULTISPECIES: NAD-dependent epimerase/dehydratase family protein [Rhizobium]|uniref:NAD-dependent epimerase/dehydratase family protein n=1 Tax=Rhizobium TaxID=379 RepID=UPI0007E989DC|nr:MULTISPECIES: NAD(P)-dependent oxidoreductase [Rhizobium]ANK87135.1 NAD-dependent epimerase/dehydratase family protein [Rhizobium sp. N731]ANK93090.1 NAD-dependent epimerase/dehydratase family protein [Rhizobium sp. N6212]ANK99136.1 NAD-dependent epimerase/dehydratase family protein [Rhizobium sp. N621]ANL05267.1 NAD-dependent epimerase/dehydratase family protein [Rhizobium esperanzae]ANL11321.1 NAD-dependent epimerase/dehydratase family protein [Rhizobium sp. N1341]
MTILVTGSAGHLGEALMRSLRAQSRWARGIDIKPSAFTDMVGSIGDRGFIRRAMSGISHVIHAATLHKPHVATHGNRDFLDTNVGGTLNLLEEATAAGVASFVFTSTTSAFGAALTPVAGEPAAWVTEDVLPVAKNIYGVTKLAAEGISELFARKSRLPVVILRTSRFFPESDDDREIRNSYSAENAQANELLHRRVDISDVVGAHLLALEKAPAIGFGRYIISATTPFLPGDVAELRRDAPAVVERLFPGANTLYAECGWKMFPTLDRVYVNERARRELGWQPRYDFRFVVDCLRERREWRSPLAIDVGSKGYHEEVFAEGPYPVD